MSITRPPIIGDTGWYDSGTTVIMTYDHAWNVTTRQSRIVATGYNINDGRVITVGESGNGSFTVKLDVNSTKVVNIESTTHFYIGFTVADASQSRTINPSGLQIQVGNRSQVVMGLSVWLDKGLRFAISNVTFEGLDVTPASNQQFSSDRPSEIIVVAQVYDAALRVTDLLGLPVSGAEVSMNLANGTFISGLTGSDGAFLAQNVPRGTFSARVSSLGLSTQLAGDASKEAITPIRLYISVTSLLLVGMVIVWVGVTVFVLRYFLRKRKSRL